MKNKNWKLEDDLFTIEYVMKYYKSKDWNDLIEFISNYQHFGFPSGSTGLASVGRRLDVNNINISINNSIRL